MANSKKTANLTEKEQQNRRDFKEVYYTTTDKKWALKDLANNLDAQPAAELRALIVEMEALTDKLAAFADKNLTNWD